MIADTRRFTFLVTGSEVGHIGPESLCYELPALPPPEDFPVMVNSQGGPVSRYGDSKWVVGGVSFNFGTNPSDLGSHGRSLTEANGELLKRCVSWFMYGERRGVGVKTLYAYHSVLKPIFAFCSSLAKPIVASNIRRLFPTLDTELAHAIRPTNTKTTVCLLHELWQAREHLGFTLLEPKQIAHLVTLIVEHKSTQTQFIPPRIWVYQAQRMGSFLQDFLDHKVKFDAALRELLDTYRVNFGSLAKSRRAARSQRNPFSKESTKHIRGCTYLGSFADFAERHGIRDVLGRWLFRPGQTWENTDPRGKCIRLLSYYFNAIGLVGTAYLQCFSGMRICEALSLRSNCLTVEPDPLLGDIYILRGETSKTTQDDDARWLTAPTVELALEAMSTVARWRTDIGVELGGMPLSSEDRENPYLIQRPYEPWLGAGARVPCETRPTVQRPSGYSINQYEAKVAGLFEKDVMRITADDEAFVRRFNAKANLEAYGEGRIWKLASHQYRRTVAVMMGASQVSLEAQQYQFKQLTLNQGVYYRTGSQNVQLNQSFAHELVSTKYELVSVELGLLNGPEYVSPISPKRKGEILRFHEVSSGDEIQKAIKKGELAVKQTLFGVCTRRDSCPYGGHDNYAHCSDCNDALLSKRRRSGVEQLGKTIAVRLLDVPLETPLRAQLERSARAVERFMDVTA